MWQRLLNRGSIYSILLRIIQFRSLTTGRLISKRFDAMYIQGELGYSVENKRIVWLLLPFKNVGFSG